MAAILDMRKYPPHCPRPSTNSPIHPRADSTPHPRYRPHTLASSPPSELTPYSLPPSFKVRGDVFLNSVGSLRFSSQLLYLEKIWIISNVSPFHFYLLPVYVRIIYSRNEIDTKLILELDLYIRTKPFSSIQRDT